MATVTLLQLRTQAKQRADMERSNFVATTEWDSYINASLAELHDIMIAAYGEDYYVSSSSFATVQAQASYNLPSDFYKLRGVDVQINGVSPEDYCTIQKFNFNERNRFNINGFWNYAGMPFIRYRLLGSQISFSPVPDRATNVRLWYHPMVVKLVADTDNFNDINGWSEYVIVDAAIKALNKEESDVSILLAQKEALRQRIISMSQNRDAGTPESVSDIHAENDDYYYRGGS